MIQAELSASTKKTHPNKFLNVQASPIPSIQGRMNKSNKNEEEIEDLIPSTTPKP